MNIARRAARWMPATVLLLFAVAGTAGPALVGSAARDDDLRAALEGPSWQHLLGTDTVGRDSAARLVAGAQGSFVAVAVVLSSCLLIGALIGGLAGWYGGAVDWVVLRVVDIFTGIPTLLLGLTLAAKLGGSTADVAFALAATLWPPYVRVVRTEVRLRRDDPSNQALTLLGASGRQILLRHVLPACAGPVVVLLGVSAAEVVLGVATLSFLGLGAQPPVAEWGTMIADSRSYLTTAPWLFFAPAVAVTAVVVSANLLAAQAGRWFTLGTKVSDEPGPAAAPRVVRLPDPRPATGAAVLDVHGLTVDVLTATQPRRVVDGLTLQVERGGCVAVVGPSGSGKTMAFSAALGLTPPSVRMVTGGSVRLLEHELIGLDEKQMRRLRGRVVSYIPQDVGGTLDPLRKVGAQLARVVRLHTGCSRTVARSRALDLIRQVGIDDAVRVAGQRPSLLSGGMRQRVLIAAALAGEPALLVADEPTSALDAATGAGIVELLLHLRDTLGLALLLITHDLALALRAADTVCVLESGAVVETGPAATFRLSAQSEVARRLLAADDIAPGVIPPSLAMAKTALQVTGLGVSYPGRGARPPVTGLAPLDLIVLDGEAVAVVGRSGSGKSTLCRALVGIEPHARGTVLLGGKPVQARAGLVQLVFQDPTSALDRRQTAMAALEEALRLTHPGVRDVRGDALELLHRVGLTEGHGARRPWQLSGGERQRLVIARALTAHPRLLVLDEPVSALDTATRGEITELLIRLRDEGLGMVVVSHDLSVVHRLCHRTLVVEAGAVVDQLGPDLQPTVVDELGPDLHPVTRLLLHAHSRTDARLLPTPILRRTP